ncbi:MAG: type II secretion system GspH family protein [Verrucomicrobiales bacterium]|nr:type II secretion system GspH family protein [Verrucomicrobiales bacterium]
MNTPAPRSSRQSAFTLIELLVVIVIIAILATAAFPIYGIIKDKANSSNSRTNLRSIGQALALYQGQNNLAYPAIQGNAAIPELDNWVSELVIALNPELTIEELISEKPTDIFVSQGLRWKSGGGFYDEEELLNTYAATDALAGLDENGIPDPELKRRVATIEQPAETIILVEAKQASNNPFCEPWLDWDTASTDFGRSAEDTQSIDLRYSEEVNVLFADGRCISMDAETLAKVEEWNWSGNRYPKDYR